MTVNEAIEKLIKLRNQGFGDLPLLSAPGLTISQFRTAGVAEEDQDFIPTWVVFTREHFKPLTDRHN